jgi:prepilin-type N-terminal cleavage/methylation domain-containing protein
MKQNSFHNMKSFCKGFTLVELSIVMIIVGLLIGGIFGGIKLIDNANIQKTIQDLKSMESAALTFRDTYGRLPGDIRNPSTRLPNCITPLCAEGGDGNRILELGTDPFITPPTLTSETVTFWHHLRAADLLGISVNPSAISVDFGEAQPEAAVGGGYRLSTWPYTPVGSTNWNPQARAVLLIVGSASGNVWTDVNTNATPCTALSAIDRKMDDGIPVMGRYGVLPWLCVDPDNAPDAVYNSLSERGVGLFYPRW